jgi:hypothetical protein
MPPIGGDRWLGSSPQQVMASTKGARMGQSADSRGSSLRRVGAIALALLVGVGTYLLVMRIASFHQPTAAPDVSAFPQSGVTAGGVWYWDKAETGPGPPKQPPVCWDYIPPPKEVTVGEAADIGVKVSACYSKDLPPDTSVEAVLSPSQKGEVALSDPGETDRTPAAQTWKWAATAHSAGEYKVFFLVRGTGLEKTSFPELITAHNATGDYQGGWPKWLTGGGGVLPIVVSVLALIPAAITAWVQLRGTRTKAEPAQATSPTPTDADVITGKNEGEGRGKHAAGQ